MRKQLLVIGIMLVLLIVGLSGCIEDEQRIYAKKFNGEPDNFVNMTEKQMKRFPLLKEAILTNKTVEVPSSSQEITEVGGIFKYFDTNFICYQNEYYEIQIFCAD